jgi:hypothetical protein
MRMAHVNTPEDRSGNLLKFNFLLEIYAESYILFNPIKKILLFNPVGTSIKCV